MLLNPGRKHRIFLWSLPTLCLANLCVCIIVLFAQCRPVQSQWDPSIHGRCLSPNILINLSYSATGKMKGIRNLDYADK